jgi:hypothetical protein
MCTFFVCPGIRKSGFLSWCSNEPSGSIKGGEGFLNLRNCRELKKFTTPVLWRYQKLENVHRIFTAKIGVRDEATFQISALVDGYNFRILVSNNQHAVTVGARDIPKFSVFCDVSRGKVIVFFFCFFCFCFCFGACCTVTGAVHLDKLQEFLMPVLEE